MESSSLPFASSQQLFEVGGDWSVICMRVDLSDCHMWKVTFAHNFLGSCL